jgi:hypothetical protein
MASASIQKFTEFSQDYDDWQIYAERLEQHFAACKIKDEENSLKVAILISSLSSATYKLLRDLTHPQLPKEKTFDQLATLLKNQFGNQVNIWRERRKFYEVRQSSEETIAEWHAKLKSAATNCAFGDRLVDILRDRFITGMCPSKILDRLCEESQDENLENLIKLATKVENIAKETRENVNYTSKFPPNFKAPRTGATSQLPQQQRHHHGRWGTRETSAPISRHDGRNVNHSKNVNNPVSKNNFNYYKYQSNFNNNKHSSHFNKNFNVCKHCSIGNHKSFECYYKNNRCEICKKVGHISKICTNNKKNINLVQGVDEKSEQNYENFKSSDVFYVEKYDNNKKIKKDKRLLNQCNGKKREGSRSKFCKHG